MKAILNKKLITKHAYMRVCSRSAVATKRYNYAYNFRKGLDFRTNYDKAIFCKIKDLIRVLDFSEISRKQIERANNRYIAPVSNYRNNKLTVDYIKNKSSIKYISENCIYFQNGRNHWAKNDNDLKIIAVLRKNFISFKTKTL